VVNPRAIHDPSSTEKKVDQVRGP
jgi:hypothetical protein